MTFRDRDLNLGFKANGVRGRFYNWQANLFQRESDMTLLVKNDTPRGCFVEMLAFIGGLTLVIGAFIKARDYG